MQTKYFSACRETSMQFLVQNFYNKNIALFHSLGDDRDVLKVMFNY